MDINIFLLLLKYDCLLVHGKQEMFFSNNVCNFESST